MLKKGTILKYQMKWTNQWWIVEFQRETSTSYECKVIETSKNNITDVNQTYPFTKDEYIILKKYKIKRDFTRWLNEK